MKKKVLLIEDDKIVRENTSEILELANYEVETAENGKKGVYLAKKNKPDIIICDILMPVLDGYGVLQILSKTKGLNTIPFIFLTAKTHHEEIRKGMEFGADDYISKPFEESVLLRAIESRLKRLETFENKTISFENTIDNKDISISNLKNFLESKRVYKFDKNETIFCEGNQSNHIFLIKKGFVKTYKLNEFGKEFNTGYFVDKEYFGYSSFAKHSPHTENSKAIAPTYLYKIDKDEITAILKGNPQILFKVIDVLAADLIKSKDRLLLQAYGSVRKKTAATLLQLLETYPITTSREIVITRLNLANSIGIAKETLTRTLHDFKNENLIEVSNKAIKILNKKKLLQIT